MNSGRVIVRGADLRTAPLLDTADANSVEFYDRTGQLMCFFTKVFNDDTWGLCTRGDADWPEMCVRYGFAAVNAAPAQQLISDGVRPFIRGSI